MMSCIALVGIPPMTVRSLQLLRRSRCLPSKCMWEDLLVRLSFFCGLWTPAFAEVDELSRVEPSHGVG